MAQIAFSVQEFQSAPRAYVETLLARLNQLQEVDQSRHISEWTKTVWGLGYAVDEYAICVGQYVQSNLALRMGSWSQWVTQVPMGQELAQMYAEAKRKYDRKKPLLKRICRNWGEDTQQEAYIAQASVATLEDLAKLGDAKLSYKTVKDLLNLAVFARLKDEYDASTRGKRFGVYRTLSLVATKRDYDRFCERRHGHISVANWPEAFLCEDDLRNGIPGRPLKLNSNGFLDDDHHVIQFTSRKRKVEEQKKTAGSAPNVLLNAVNSDDEPNLTPTNAHRSSHREIQVKGSGATVSQTFTGRTQSRGQQRSLGTFLTPVKTSQRRVTRGSASKAQLPTPAATPSTASQKQKGRNEEVRNEALSPGSWPTATVTSLQPSRKRNRNTNENPHGSLEISAKPGLTASHARTSRHRKELPGGREERKSQADGEVKAAPSFDKSTKTIEGARLSFAASSAIDRSSQTGSRNSSPLSCAAEDDAGPSGKHSTRVEANVESTDSGLEGDSYSEREISTPGKDVAGRRLPEFRTVASSSGLQYIAYASFFHRVCEGARILEDRFNGMVSPLRAKLQEVMVGETAVDHRILHNTYVEYTRELKAFDDHLNSFVIEWEQQANAEGILHITE